MYRVRANAGEVEYPLASLREAARMHGAAALVIPAHARLQVAPLPERAVSRFAPFAGSFCFECLWVHTLIIRAAFRGVMVGHALVAWPARFRPLSKENKTAATVRLR